MNKLLAKVAIAAAVASAGFSANAAPVLGTATLNTGTVNISFNEIDWSPSNAGLSVNPTYGTINNLGAALGGVNTGSFSSLSNLFTPITIQDLSNNPADGNYAPAGSSLNISNFLSFSSNPGWLFTLTNVALGTQGPYTLTQIGNGVTASLSFSGTICDSEGDGVCNIGDDVTNWTGIFSANFDNTTISALVNDVLNGQTLVQKAFSGTITASEIPEPGSVALIGLGLVGLAATRRRRTVK